MYRLKHIYNKVIINIKYLCTNTPPHPTQTAGVPEGDPSGEVGRMLGEPTYCGGGEDMQTIPLYTGSIKNVPTVPIT